MKPILLNPKWNYTLYRGLLRVAVLSPSQLLLPPPPPAPLLPLILKSLPMPTDIQNTRKIPEPAPFLSWHGAQIGGLQIFSVIKVTVVRQVRMSPVCTAITLSMKINTRKMPRSVQRSWTWLFLLVELAKTRRPAIWASWLTTPLHEAVYEVWDLPCTGCVRKNYTIFF